MVTYTCIAPNIIKDSLAINLAQWFASPTRNVEVVRSSPIKGPHCFLEQETTLITKNWLVPVTDLSVISQSN